MRTGISTSDGQAVEFAGPFTVSYNADGSMLFGRPTRQATPLGPPAVASWPAPLPSSTQSLRSCRQQPSPAHASGAQPAWPRPHSIPPAPPICPSVVQPHHICPPSASPPPSPLAHQLHPERCPPAHRIRRRPACRYLPLDPSRSATLLAQASKCCAPSAPAPHPRASSADSPSSFAASLSDAEAGKRRGSSSGSSPQHAPAPAGAQSAVLLAWDAQLASTAEAFSSQPYNIATNNCGWAGRFGGGLGGRLGGGWWRCTLIGSPATPQEAK